MPLSRLDNFLKNVRGNILYVNPNDLDATDSIENQGNSMGRPFKTIQRALIEAARFSYQRGLDNDRFGKTTILLYPGEHLIDNRPGWIPDGSNNFRLRNGTTSSDFGAFNLSTNFDLTSPNNALYKLNSIHGGVIVPRGTSIVGLDLRKTQLRPKYVPNPENGSIERSAVLRVTGACYFWQFSLFDGDPNSIVYKDYTNNTFIPNFSHHKLTCFEYADGVNDVNIDDSFMTYSTDRTDLEMYYEKVGLAYGPSSGREIEPDYPSSGLDIQPKIDEYRIVGPTGGEVGISSIKAGDGVTSSTVVTVTLVSGLSGLDVDTAFEVDGISATGYDGQFVVSEVLSSDADGTTSFKYEVQNSPTNPLPSPVGSTVSLNTDTVTSASPYIFNISLRSVYGMCGCHADGNNATGFKSMVVAQFTGIGLQKDNNAFVKYDSSSGTYKDSTFAGNENIHTDSLAAFKPTYENYHIKASNNSFLQLVSIFAIGYAVHFLAESGGDYSITNSNSNFGAKALVSSGFRRDAFGRDDVGYITHIIPPKQLTTQTTAIEFGAIDVAKTVGVGSTSRLYLYNENNIDVPPQNVIEGYRIGAKSNDSLKVLISQGGSLNQHSARIIMPNTANTSNETTGEKKFLVGRNAGINSISSNIVTLTEPHSIIEGESIRFLSDDGRLPDGLESNRVYFAITSGIGTDQIKVAQTLNDAINGQELPVNNKGGVLNVFSRVSDKNSGDIGHPIQYDTNESQWYINVSTAATDNDLYSTIVSLGTTSLGAATPRTFISRQPDTRNLIDTIYRARYVIPAGSGITSARPPIDGFVIQESNDVTGASNAEVLLPFDSTPRTMSNLNEMRNFKFISGAKWSGGTAEITTELPHKLSINSQVEIKDITSTNNTTGIASAGFNGTYNVVGINSAKSFNVSITDNPGTFTNNTSSRTTSLPTFRRKRYNDTYYVYRSQEIKRYVAGEQDGVYHLILLNASNSPSVEPFSDLKFPQPVKDLYPQTDRDNPQSDAKSSISFALPNPIGQVVIDDPRHSLTRETLDKTLIDTKVGFALTNIVSNSAGTAHTIYTSIDHGLNAIAKVSIGNSGASYGSGAAGNLYNARLVGFAGSTTGQHATARITVDALGGITDVKIIDGGSAYGVGNTLAVVGVATTSGFTQGYVTVTSIYNNAGDSIRISGVGSEKYNGYNDLYRITGITVGNDKEFTVSSASTVGNGAQSAGVGVTFTASAFGYLTGKTLTVSSISYNPTTGFATVTTAQNHGLQVDNKIRISGGTNSFFNGNFIVKNNTSLTTFTADIGISTSNQSTSGTIHAYQNGFTSNDGFVSIDNENVGGRMTPIYAGITTTLSAVVSNAITDDIELQNISTLDVNIGDYFLIDNEIVRVKTTVTGNPVKVFRGVFGTRSTSHVLGSVVRRIHVDPIEFRRNSIIRASGHTFEYLGFGPGNYSTAFPDKQDRLLSSQEELLSQSLKLDGGINVYTGMNSDGDFYIGNKKVSSATGQEEVFDAPIPTVTGEDLSETGVSVGFDVLTPLEASISRSIRVEGGPDNNIISEFDGPVIFNNKITSNSSKGIEANSIFLQGNATVSRKYTVGITQPTLAGNPGDIEYNANPSKGGTIGWVYTLENGWYPFGGISIDVNSNIAIFDGVGIGTTSPGESTFKVGSGTSQFTVDGTGGVGIGTTANGVALRVEGTIIGNFQGDGSGLTNLDSIWQKDGTNSWVFTKDDANLKVGIGTSIGVDTQLKIAGTASTSLLVENQSRFIATAHFNSDVNVSGTLSADDFDLDNATTGRIRAGIITATALQVGAAGTIINAQSTGSVGVGTQTPRAKFDIEGSAKFKTYSENVQTLSIASNNVDIDLSLAQTFNLTVNSTVNTFTILNPPSGATAFTLKITQGSTAFSVPGISTYFKDSGGGNIDVYWAGGGVKPIVTPVANKTDIYSFMTFDGTSNLYGVIGGQNFA